MKNSINTRYHAKDISIITMGFLSTAIGILALLGWMLHLPLLTSFSSISIPMAPITALLFILIGSALAFCTFKPQSRSTYFASLAMGLLVTIMGLILFFLSYMRIYPDIERLGFSITGSIEGVPIGYIAPLSAICFVSCGMAFLLAISQSAERSKRPWISLFLASLVLVTYLLLTPYLFWSPLMYSGSIIPPAPPTAIAFLCVAIGLCIKAGFQIWSYGRIKSIATERVTYILVLIFILLTAGILTGGYFAYRSYELNYRAEAENQISSIAKLKVNQLMQWRKERLGDANVFFKNEAFAGLVKRYIDNRNDADAKKRIQTWMEQFYLSYFYCRACFHDKAGAELLSFPEGKIVVPHPFSKHSAEALESKKIVFQDFYRDENDQKIYLNIIIPILDEYDNSKTLGVLSLRIDPAQYLYPMIQEWPGISKTSETLIIRLEGNEIVFLNDLRFQKNTALNLRISLSNVTMPAVKAALGQEGIIEGIDYRGAPVIADVRAVPNSPWFLVARTDLSEVYGPLKERLWIIVILMCALLVGAGASVGFVWRQQRSHFYKEQFQSLTERKEIEDKFKYVFDNSSIGKSITLSSGEVNANKALCDMLGYTLEELNRLRWQDLTHPDDIELTQKYLDLIISGEKDSTCFIKRYIHKNGSIVWADLSTTLRRDTDGRPMYFMTTVMDITKRKQAEEKLITSEVRFRRLFEASKDGILILDANTGLVIDVNPFMIELLGYSSAQFEEKAIWELGFLKDIIANKDNFLQLQQKGYVRYDNLPLETSNGKICYVEFISNVYQVDHLKVIQCNIRDITERKQAEYKLREAEVELRNTLEKSNQAQQRLLNVLEDQRQAEESLRKSEAQLRAVLDATPFPIALVDMEDNNIDFWSRSALTIFGYTAPTAAEWYQIAYPDPDYRQDVINRWKPSLEKAKWSAHAVNTGEYNVTCRDGSVRICELYAAFIENNLIVTFNDITERKQAVEALQKSEDMLRSIFVSSPDSITVMDLQGKITLCNQTTIAIHGYSSVEQLVGKSLYEMVATEERQRAEEGIKQVMMHGFVKDVPFIGLKGSGETFAGELSVSLLKDSVGRPSGFVGITKDITERKHAEEAIRQMQKLEGLGTLAGGIAHDFNNILGIILAYNENIKRIKDDSKKLDHATDTITKAVDRGKTLVQQILTFARKTETTFGAVNVNEVVMEIVNMIYEMFPKTVTCSQSFDKSIHYINADHSQLNQVLMNLCVNARDAMPNGGVLSIRTHMVSVANLRSQHPEATESSYVCIEVSDTGEGMTPETQKRIFEPFFTTKGIGKGTGLGLSVTFGVIQTHRGFIDVESELGKGTTFRLYLPALQAAEPVVEEAEKNFDEIPGGTETLLIVEDEEMLAMPLQMSLTDKGYKVIYAADGFMALKIYEEKKNEIALVLTDLGLPTISGLEVSQRIKIIDPDAHIILASGFIDPEMKQEFLDAGINHFLYKPYDLTNVLKMVREVLEKK